MSILEYAFKDIAENRQNAGFDRNDESRDGSQSPAIVRCCRYSVVFRALTCMMDR